MNACYFIYHCSTHTHIHERTQSTRANLSLNNGSTLGRSPTPNCYRCKRVCVIEDERRLGPLERHRDGLLQLIGDHGLVIVVHV